MSHSTWITLLIRFSLGIIFIAHGIGKVLTYPQSPTGIIDGFVETWLPSIVVVPFAYVLPFLELALGAAILVGYQYVPALVLTGALLAVLSFGKVIQGQPVGVAPNLTYFLVILGGIHFSASNKWQLGK